MIEIRDLNFSHIGNDREEKRVLEGISIDINENRFTTILGRNGSGKTTLLKCIGGFWSPRSGMIRIAGRDLGELTTRQKARRIAYVPQHHQPVFSYKVSDVVLMGRTPHIPRFGFPGKKDRRIAQEALDTLGISRLAGRTYTRLSGGERQLVLIARCLAQQSEVMLLDEPVSHLDFKNQIGVMSLIRRVLRERQLTVLVTLHDPNLAAAFSDDLVLIKKGRVMATGGAESMITERNLSELYGMNISVVNGSRKLVYAADEPVADNMLD